MPKKVLIIGDVHAVSSELEDCENLLDFIEIVIEENNVTEVIFLGDIYNNHDALSVKVVNFWANRLKSSTFRSLDSISIVLGNHDQSNPIDNHPNALTVHEEYAHVFDSVAISKNTGYIPYTYDKDKFLQHLEYLKGKVKTIICHQTFDGSKYENGTYAKDGVPIDDLVLSFDKIISGHIHTAQSFANITYVGSPRWRSVSDAGKDKHVSLYEVENGIFAHLKDFSTKGACRQIITLEDRDFLPIDTSLYDTKKDSVRVSCFGTQNYTQERTKYLRSLGFLAKGFPDKQGTIKVKESEGINKAWDDYLATYKPPFGSNIKDLANLIGNIFQ